MTTSVLVSTYGQPRPGQHASAGSACTPRVLILFVFPLHYMVHTECLANVKSGVNVCVLRAVAFVALVLRLNRSRRENVITIESVVVFDLLFSLQIPFIVFRYASLSPGLPQAHKAAVLGVCWKN